MMQSISSSPQRRVRRASGHPLDQAGALCTSRTAPRIPAVQPGASVALAVTPGGEERPCLHSAPYRRPEPERSPGTVVPSEVLRGSYEHLPNLRLEHWAGRVSHNSQAIILIWRTASVEGVPDSSFLSRPWVIILLVQHLAQLSATFIADQRLRLRRFCQQVPE